MNLCRISNFILFFINTIVTSRQGDINVVELNNHDSVDETNNENHTPLLEIDTSENENNQFCFLNLLSYLDLQEYNSSEVSGIQDNTNSNCFASNSFPSNSTSTSNTFFKTSSDITTQNYKMIENKDVFSKSTKRKVDFAEVEEPMKKKKKVSEPYKKWIHTILIKSRVENMVCNNVQSVYYRYVDFKNSSFILIHLDDLIHSCFSCYDYTDIENFKFLIIDIFLYYRFTAVDNALKTKKRVIDILGTIVDLNNIFGTPTSTTRYIFYSDKRLCQYSTWNFLMYPNIASHRMYYNENRAYDSTKSPFMFINNIIESIPKFRDSIISILNYIVTFNFNHLGNKLSEEDKNAILSQLSKPIHFEPFESILDMGIRGINLEEDDHIFNKFYNNLFINHNGDKFQFKGSEKSIRIQKFIIFVKTCIYEQENQLTCLEYITLFNYMSKEYKKYINSEDKSFINEPFFNSLCFFVQSFSYDSSINGDKVTYSFKHDPYKNQKGFRLLKQLFPNWEELISEDKFSFML